MKRLSSHALYDFALGMTLLGVVPLVPALLREQWRALAWFALTVAFLWSLAWVVGRRSGLSLRRYLVDLVKRRSPVGGESRTG